MTLKAAPPGFPSIDEFRRLPAEAQLKFLEAVELQVTKGQVRPWRKTARPKQLPPSDPRHHLPDKRGFRCGCKATDLKYNIHLVMAGRGMGKTFMGANWIAEMASSNPNSEWAVLAPSFRDVRKTCFESDVGVIRALQPGEMSNYRRNELQIVLSNGSVIYGYSAENPDKVRGANLWGAWCDELASWRYPATWYEGLLPALRKGEHPRIVVTTTPRPVRLINDLVGRADGTVHITRGSTWENEANLSDIALAELRHRYEGTRLGRQELEGELLEDLEGALWNRRMLDEARVTEASLPPMVRVIVAVDPALSSDPDSDETGIVVAGEGADGHGYILDDLSARVSPMQAMKIAIRAYRKWEADCVVAEVNNGGDFVRDLLRNVDPQVPYKSIRASRGKAVRAQPVSALYEQGKIHHVGCFPQLEDQMCLWVPESLDSPDRMDACLIAGTPVLTARGTIPIEQVTPGDLAWTRLGWRPVLASRLTRPDAVVTQVELSSGDTLTGTADHRVWTRINGWTGLGSLAVGDILSGWQIQPPATRLPAASSTGAPFTPAHLTVSSGRTGSITAHQPAGTRIAECCTATSGATITAAPSRTGGISTMPTSTRSTMTPPTWPPSRRQSMRSSMLSASAWSSYGRCSAPACSPRETGIAAKTGLPGTPSTAGGHGTSGSPCTPSRALSAGLSSRPTSTAGATVSATAPAAASCARERASTWKRSPAQCAAEISSGTATTAGPRPAAVSVVRSSVLAGRWPVYDLTIAGVHEFTASGVIVHNCVWAISELRGLGEGSWAAVYGTTRCEGCDRMYLRRDRVKCPHCGHAASAEGVA